MRLVTTIDGVLLKSPNGGAGFVSRGGMFANAKRIRELRQTIYLRVLAMVGRRKVTGIPRVTLTRLSAGELDVDNLHAACKPCWDSVARGLGLKDDRALQKAGAVAQETCPRGSCGVRIEVEIDE